MSMAGRLAERYTAWAVEVTKMAQASSLFTAWWRHSVPDRALVESRFTTSTPMHSNPRTKATTRRVFSSFRFTVTIYVSCLRPWKSNGDYRDSPRDRISRGIDPESIVWRGAKKSPSTREKELGAELILRPFGELSGAILRAADSGFNDLVIDAALLPGR
jgi:hypothetical protein